MELRAGPLVFGLVATSMALTAVSLPTTTLATFASLSLGSGVAALSLMAAAATLGSRWRWLESAFGGLDRLYEIHKWLGVWALCMASVHLAFKAGLPTWDTAAILPLPGGITRLLRQLAFLGLMATLLLALNRRIPYSVWRWWHKLSGVVLLVVVAHWLSIKSPITLASPAGLWLAALGTLGLLGAAWKLFLYPWFSPHADYRIVAVEHGPNALRIELAPTRRGIAFKPGQFGFLRLEAEGLREPHPFTLAGAPRPDGHVVLMIRALGDHTRRLVAEAIPSMHASVYGPFGRFERRPGASMELWIAGGVGISPFLAWLDDPAGAGFDRVTLFYFHTPGRSFPSPEALAALAHARGASLVCIDDGPGARLFLDALAARIRAVGAEGVSVDFCGPQGLLDEIAPRLRTLGVPHSRIRHELFEFR